MSTASDCILSLTLMIKSGCTIDFKCGRKGDPQYRGKITLPDGRKITMIFEDNLWCLPLWTPAKARITAEAKKTSVLTSNPYSALAELIEEDSAQCNANFE